MSSLGNAAGRAYVKVRVLIKNERWVRRLFNMETLVRDKDISLEKKIENVKADLINLYHIKKSLRDPDILKKSMELDHMINQYQRGLLSSDRR